MLDDNRIYRKSIMDINNKSFRKIESLFDVAFYILFSVFFNYHFMRSTMFYADRLKVHAEFLKSIYNYSYWGLVILSVFSLIFVYKGIKNRLFPLCIFVVVLLYNHFRCVSEYPAVAVFFMLVICSKNKSFPVLGKIILGYGWIWIIASAIGCKAGYISDIVFYGTRHSFGSIYMTDLACHFLTLMMVLCIVRQGKLKMYEYVLGVFLLGVNYLFMKAKIGFSCLSLLLIGTFLHQYFLSKRSLSEKTKDVYKFFCIYGILFLVPLTMVLTATYSDSPAMFYNKFNLFGSLRSRFMLGKQALETYPFTLFGVPIQEHGNGGNKTGIVENYFFIDISYLRILLMEGVLVWLMSIALFIKTQVKMSREKKYYYMFVVAIFVIDCAIEHHIIEIAYSFLPYLLFCRDDKSLADMQSSAVV